MRIALYEPDIPQNTGTILRLAACLGVEAHIVEPAGFPTSDRAFRRAGMDYLDQVAIVRHTSWQAFEDWRRTAGGRLLLFTTGANFIQTTEFFGLGLDYDRRLPGLLRSVGLDDVRQAARALDPARASVVIAGPYGGK